MARIKCVELFLEKIWQMPWRSNLFPQLQWYEAMTAANTDIFKMSFEESASYFKGLYYLKIFWHINNITAILPVENTKHINSSVGKSKKPSKQWYHYCDKNSHKMTECQAIAKCKWQKKLALKLKLLPEKSLWFFFSKKSMHLNGSWFLKRLEITWRGRQHLSYLPKLILTTSSDEYEEFFVTSPNFFRARKSKLAKSSHHSTELVVSLNVNHEEHLVRALADSIVSSSNILETNT
jgi:hypothetical protein